MAWRSGSAEVIVPAVGQGLAGAQRALTWALALCVVAWLAALVLKGRLPPAAGIAPALLQEPLQPATDRAPFQFAYRGRAYAVTPVAGYELWGLIVSHNNIGAISDIYHNADDVDLKDIAVLWGGNLRRDDFRRVQFSSNAYVCYYRYPHGVSFNDHEFANVHLLAGDARVQQQIRGLHVADQVRLRGLLVNYSPVGSTWTRQTSTTRNDTGMGACEVLYVEEVAVLRRGTPGWYLAATWGWRLALALLAAKLLLLFLVVRQDQQRQVQASPALPDDGPLPRPPPSARRRTVKLE